MRPVEWEIDELTSVRIVQKDGGAEIWLKQNDDLIRFESTGASPGAAALALLAATNEVAATEAVFDFPDLSQYFPSDT